MLGLIPDGYTESGVIQERPRIHPAVKIKWRPMLIETYCLYERAVEEHRGYDLRLILAKEVICKHLVQWDLKGADGRIPEITVDNVLRLKPALFNALTRIISGEEAALPDPKSPKDQDREAQILSESLREQRTPLAVAQERDEKNY